MGGFAHATKHSKRTATVTGTPQQGCQPSTSARRHCTACYDLNSWPLAHPGTALIPQSSLVLNLAHTGYALQTHSGQRATNTC